MVLKLILFCNFISKFKFHHSKIYYIRINKLYIDFIKTSILKRTKACLRKRT